MTIKYNVVADGWTNGEFCLFFHVNTKEEAQECVGTYTERYEGKPFPNGKGWYPYKNFRVIEVDVSVHCNKCDDPQHCNWAYCHNSNR